MGHLGAVKRVPELLIAQQGQQAMYAYTELYEMLSIKHHSDPALINIRIAHLQTSLTAERREGQPPAHTMRVDC